MEACESDRECLHVKAKVNGLLEEIKQLKQDYALIRQQKIDRHTDYIRARGQRDESNEEIVKLRARILEFEEGGKAQGTP